MLSCSSHEKTEFFIQTLKIFKLKKKSLKLISVSFRIVAHDQKRAFAKFEKRTLNPNACSSHERSDFFHTKSQNFFVEKKILSN